MEREALSLERPLDVMTPAVPQSENSIMDIETEGMHLKSKQGVLGYRLYLRSGSLPAGLHSSRSLLAEDIQWMMVYHAEGNISSHQTPAESTTPLSSGNPAPCQCEAEIVRVVQQLDDDTFQLSTLPLDRVLQLQKWLIFHCCKPLSCPSCSAVATCHAMILVVCDRLTEMFECIHRRIRRYGGVTTAPDDAYPPSTQLFTADGAASKAVCTTLLFSLELNGQYSDEEQVHMIQVLLNLSVRNLRRLLARAEELSKIGGGQARLLRIRSLLARLGKAVEDIDNAFCDVLQSFSLDGDRLA